MMYEKDFKNAVIGTPLYVPAPVLRKEQDEKRLLVGCGCRKRESQQHTRSGET